MFFKEFRGENYKSWIMRSIQTPTLFLPSVMLDLNQLIRIKHLKGRVPMTVETQLKFRGTFFFFPDPAVRVGFWLIVWDRKE